MTVVIVVTHHLTGYAMVVALWAHVAMTLRAPRPGVRPPIAMAVAATLTSVAWATIVAGGTGGYLGSIFTRLIASVSQAASDAGTTHAIPGRFVRRGRGRRLAAR